MQVESLLLVVSITGGGLSSSQKRASEIIMELIFHGPDQTILGLNFDF